VPATCDILKEELDKFKAKTDSLRLEDFFIPKQQTASVMVEKGLAVLELIADVPRYTIMKAHVSNGTRFLRGKHEHTQTEIIINLEGKLHMRINGAELVTISPGEVLVIPPDTPHDPEWYEGDNVQIAILIPRVAWFNEERNVSLGDEHS
jgi:quercetin dioxygenase-like cupin family protein